jgi:hypothetical protein
VSSHAQNQLSGLASGSFIADAIAMPVQRYWDRAELNRKYYEVRDGVAPRNPHADSIL